MKRVAALWLPHWSIDRIVRAEPTLTSPPETGDARIAAAPRNRGWRPGARWARDEAFAQRLRSDDGAPRTAAASFIQGKSSAAPLVTQHKVGSRVLIAAVSPAALALGIEPSMALTQARACVPGLIVRAADPDGDRADLLALATVLTRRWTPGVALAEDDTLFLDLTGLAHLHGGERRFARRLAGLLARHGFTARVAIADTTGAAWALAHHAPSASAAITCCPPDGHDAALPPLPAAALRFSPDTVALLARFGIDTIGAVFALPRASFARRFGAAALQRLDAATGAVAEPLDPIVPPERIHIEQRFAEPISTADAIAHWLGRLVSRLTQALAETGQGARVLLFVATRVDGTQQHIRIGCTRPTRDPAHLLRLLARRIETIDPGFGLDALALRVRHADALGAEALGAALAEESRPDLAVLIDCLANRIGARRLWRTRPVESDVPERSMTQAEPLDPPSQETPLLKRDDVRRLDTRPAIDPWHPRWPRPARLLARPEPLDNVLAELPDRPPARFTWRGVRHHVVRADGPERITGEWWRRSAERYAVRDYFQVEDEEGRRFWLFRRGDGERAATGDLSWYMHGAFG